MIGDIKNISGYPYCFIPFFALSHDKNSSRADLFKNELKASDELLKTIADIDNKYRSEYQKLTAEIKFHESEFTRVQSNHLTKTK